MRLLDVLIARSSQAGSTADSIDGYQSAPVNWVLSLNEAGEFLGITEHPRFPVLSPMSGKPNTPRSHTGIEDFIFTLGLAGPDLTIRKGKDADHHAWASERHTVYREMLAGLAAMGTGFGGRAAKAILAFLQHPNRPAIVPLGSDLTDEQYQTIAASAPSRWVGPGKVPPLIKGKTLTSDPAVLGAYAQTVSTATTSPSRPLKRVSAKATDTLLIRVEGLGDWWLAPDTQAYHAARLDAFDRAGKPAVRGQCSVCCGYDLELKRLFGSSRGGVLISFNASTFEAYGREQGIVAPTCVACAQGIQAGLADLITDRTTNFGWKTGTRFFWWSETRGEGLWALLNTACTRPPADADDDTIRQVEIDAKAAIEQIRGSGVSYLLILGKDLIRLPLRRFAEIDGSAVADRIACWRAHVGMNVWAASLLGLISPKPFAALRDGAEHRHLQEQLYLALVAGEPLSKGWLTRLRDSLPRVGLSTARTRRGILEWVQNQNIVNLPPEKQMTPLQQMAFTLGRAFGRTDRLHRRRANPQRSVAIMYRTQAARSPQKAIDLMLRYAEGRDSRGKTYIDSKVQSLIVEAGVPEQGPWAKGPLPPSVQTFFLLGMTHQMDLERKESEARYAARQNAAEQQPAAK